MDDDPSKFSRLEKIEHAMFSNPRGDRPESRGIDSAILGWMKIDSYKKKTRKTWRSYEAMDRFAQPVGRSDRE
jgi:hypothetical protein